MYMYIYLYILPISLVVWCVESPFKDDKCFLCIKEGHRVKSKDGFRCKACQFYFCNEMKHGERVLDEDEDNNPSDGRGDDLYCWTCQSSRNLVRD